MNPEEKASRPASAGHFTNAYLEHAEYGQHLTLMPDKHSTMVPLNAGQRFSLSSIIVNMTNYMDGEIPDSTYNIIMNHGRSQPHHEMHYALERGRMHK
ncbi:MAG: hypothetical protein Q9218_007078 [Villophora microphyllina]